MVSPIAVIFLIITLCSSVVAAVVRPHQQQKQAQQQQHWSSSTTKVTTIQMTTEEGYRMYEHWTTQAFASVLSAFLQEKHATNQLVGMVPDQFTKCYFGAQTVPLMAKCIVRLLNNEFRMPLKNAKMVDGTKKALKRQHNWVGQLRVGSSGESGEIVQQQQQQVKEAVTMPKMKDGAKKNRGGTETGPTAGDDIYYANGMPKFKLTKVRWKREKAAANFARDQRQLDTEQRTRKAPITTSKSQSYNLLDAKRTLGLSPIGGLARLLMSGVLERRNKTRAIPWQETIATIQEAKKMHNQLRRDEKKWRDFALQKNSAKGRTTEPMHKKHAKMPLKGNFVDEMTSSYGTKVQQMEQQIATLVHDGIKVGMRLAELEKKAKNASTSTQEEEEAESKSDEFGGDEEENGRWMMSNYDDDDEEKVKSAEKQQHYGRDGKKGYGGGTRATGKNQLDAVAREGGPRALTTTAAGGRLMDILSPRFMSVTARKSRGKANLLSPSLFSLHNKGHGLERRLSLPNLMKEGARLVDRDQNEWLNLIMEASGVNEQADTLKQLLSPADGHEQQQQRDEMAKKIDNRYKREFKGLYLTKENVTELYGPNEQRKADTWEKLVQNLTTDQWKEMNRTGIVSMNAEQLQMFYGQNSPFKDSEALQRLLPIVKNNNDTSVIKLIESDIHRLSEMSSFDLRKNDTVLSPSVFQPSINKPRIASALVLSPLVFSPTILAPTVLGPAILSPRFFSPPILSPRIMTPLVLSPFIFSSIILTPIIMQPFIMSPGFLNGIIISPFIMNPQIMSPHFFHPAILSPLILTPAILNPSTMSPAVLSPLVLTPQIFSPKLLSGLFLSPYALSPVLMSPVFAYLVILSPSWLS